MDYPIILFNEDTGIAELGSSQPLRGLRGIDKLVQIVCVAILKNGGQDVFDPAAGSGIRALIGQYNSMDPDEIRLEIIKRIKTVERQIVSYHNGFDVPSTEKLVKLTVLSVVTDALTGSTAVEVQVLNEAGQSRMAVV